MEIKQIRNGRSREYKYIELPRERYNLLAGRLEEGIIQVGLTAFGPGMSKAEIMEHILPTDMLYLAFRGPEIIGFATAMVRSDALDLVGAAVKKQVQGSGVYSNFSLRRINFGMNQGKDNLTLRTQNPKVELGVRLCLDSLVNVGLISGYSMTRDLREGLYGRIITSSPPYSGVDEIDSIYQLLNYQQGDAFALRFALQVRT